MLVRATRTKTLAHLVLTILVAATALHARDAGAATTPVGASAPIVVGYYIDDRDASWLSRDLAKCAPRTSSAAAPATLPTLLAESGRATPGNLDDAAQRQALITEIRAAAAIASIDVAVVARVKRTKTRRTAQVLIVPLAQPEQLLDIPLGARPDAGRDTKAIQATVAPALAAASEAANVSRGAATPAKAEPPVAERPGPEAPHPNEGRDRPSAPEPPPPGRWFDRADFIVSLSVGAMMRHFDYVDKLSTGLRTYDLGAAPMAGLNAELFPFARSGSGAVDVGLAGAFAQSFAAESAVPKGPALGTTWSQFDAGARARFRTGGEKSPVLGASAAYGGVDFTFSDAGSLAREIPESSYRFVRGGVDVRVPIARFAITAAGDYLGVMTAGAAADRFPHATTRGVAMRAGLGATIVTGLEARIGAQYTRFIYTLAPQPGDRYVAGGALDQIGNVTLGLAYFH
jgi:hypothetical protein